MMQKFLCKQIPAGDVCTRQPKSPGQKLADYNVVRSLIPAEPMLVWSNRKKGGGYRCTRCGQNHSGTA